MEGCSQCTMLGDSLDEEFVHFREGRPLCRPIFSPLRRKCKKKKSRTARRPSLP